MSDIRTVRDSLKSLVELANEKLDEIKNWHSYPNPGDSANKATPTLEELADLVANHDRAIVKNHEIILNEVRAGYASWSEKAWNKAYRLYETKFAKLENDIDARTESFKRELDELVDTFRVEAGRARDALMGEITRHAQSQSPKKTRKLSLTLKNKAPRKLRPQKSTKNKPIKKTPRKRK